MEQEDKCMIELTFKGMCEGCQVAELSLEKIPDHATYYPIKYKVLCKHTRVCEQMYKKYSGEKDK